MRATSPSPTPLMLAFKPSAALAAHVTDLWVWEIPAAAQVGNAAAITLLPDGHPTMVFSYGGALTASDGRQAFNWPPPRPVRWRRASWPWRARPLWRRCCFVNPAR